MAGHHRGRTHDWLRALNDDEKYCRRVGCDVRQRVREGRTEVSCDEGKAWKRWDKKHGLCFGEDRKGRP